jgi:hypothetical protein
MPATNPPSVPTKVAASPSSEQKKVDPKKATATLTPILKKPD